METVPSSSSRSISSSGRRCPDVTAKLFPVLCHSACRCHRTERIRDVFLPSLSWLSSASFPGYHSLPYCLLLLALGGCSWPSLMHEVTHDFLVVHIKASQKSLGDKPKSVHIFLQTPREVYTRKSYFLDNSGNKHPNLTN